MFSRSTDSRRFRATVSLVLALGFVLAAASVEAVPAFARRYSLPCHFCHDGHPQLSVIGELFKERGYRLEDEAGDARDWLRSVPGSFRGRLRQSFTEGGDNETLGLFKLVSAGNLGRRVSYWIDESYSLDGDGFSRIGTDNAFMRLEVLEDELYVRGGRIELDLPFSQARTPQLFAYRIYFANTGFETDGIGGHQDGVEMGGLLDNVTRWSAAIVKGRASSQQRELSDATGGFEGNFFGRLTRRFGEHKTGTYVYWGRKTLARSNPTPDSGAPEVLVWEDDLFRLGGDGSVYLGQSHVFGTFLYGRNGNSVADAEHPDGTGRVLSFTGGFGQLDVSVRDSIVLSGRLDLVYGPRSGETGASETFFSFSPGFRFWPHPRVRLVFEVRFNNRDRPTDGAFHVEIVM